MKKSYKLILVALIFLFNPNIAIIDLLPDFVAYFLLAHVFSRAVDISYFEDAKEQMQKLGWVTLMKLPAFLIATTVVAKSAEETAIISLLCLAFGTLELVFGIKAINVTFDSLFHLGERTSALSLISPTKKNGRAISTDMLKPVSYVFLAVKCAACSLPEMLIVSRTASFSVGDKTVHFYNLYPYALLVAFTVALAVGIFWFVKVKSYAASVHREGKFAAAIRSLATEAGIERYERLTLWRTVSLLLTVMSVISVLCIDVKLDNFNGIDLVPSFLYGVAMWICVHLFCRYANVRVRYLELTYAVYTLVSFVAYIWEIFFINKYGYDVLAFNAMAKRAYIPIECLAVAECALLIVATVLFVFMQKKLIEAHTGSLPDSANYLAQDRYHHRRLTLYAAITFGSLGLVGLMKCIDTFLMANATVKYWGTVDTDGFTGDVITTQSPIPYFTTIIFIVAIIHIIAVFYYSSTLKDEMKFKYTFD